MNINKQTYTQTNIHTYNIRIQLQGRGPRIQKTRLKKQRANIAGLTGSFPETPRSRQARQAQLSRVWDDFLGVVMHGIKI